MRGDLARQFDPLLQVKTRALAGTGGDTDNHLAEEGGGLSWKVAVGGASLGVASALALTGVGAIAMGAIVVSGVSPTATGEQAEQANSVATIAELSTAALLGTAVVVGVAGAGLVAWEFVGGEE